MTWAQPVLSQLWTTVLILFLLTRAGHQCLPGIPKAQRRRRRDQQSSETLPATSRTMQFRVTARDHHVGGGIVASADVQVIVNSNAGPFRFTGPLTTTLSAGPQTITWDAAGTAAAPVSAINVNILLSTDGGQTFPIVLASNAPNAGIKTINLPAIPTSTARFQIRAADNIFFWFRPRTSPSRLPTVAHWLLSHPHLFRFSPADRTPATCRGQPPLELPTASSTKMPSTRPPGQISSLTSPQLEASVHSLLQPPTLPSGSFDC